VTEAEAANAAFVGPATTDESGLREALMCSASPRATEPSANPGTRPENLAPTTPQLRTLRIPGPSFIDREVLAAAGPMRLPACHRMALFIVHRGTAQLVTDETAGTTVSLPRISIRGPLTQPCSLVVSSDFAATSTAMSIALGLRLLELPARGFANRYVNLMGLDPSWLPELDDCVAAARTFEDKAHAVRKAVERVASGISPSVDLVLCDLLETVLQTHSSVKAAAAHLRISERHFSRMFKESVGIPARTYARVCRLHRAIDMLGDMRISKTDATLVSVANLSGFSDQAHMNREFAELANRTPGEIAGRAREQRMRLAATP